MTPAIIIDLRCLQDTDHAERGIAAHARNAVLNVRRSIPNGQAARIIGIIDPALSDLPAEVIAVMDEIQPNAYLPNIPAGSMFLNPSPMSADQVFIARLLLDPKIRKAVLVYDFIPFDEPERYLTRPVDRLDYYSAMVWLKHYDLYLAISADTQIITQKLYAHAKSVVTGVPLAPWLRQDAAAAGPARHILMVGGNDDRKNPELLIRAHAASRFLQDHRVPLIIAGNYPAAARERLRRIAADHGGDPALLEIPGRVPNDVMRDYYHAAICVVTPSRAEGFSMPVIEAMACGVPSIASDIPVHAALVRDARLRFSPDDETALAALMERIAAAPAFRDSIIAQQATIWPAFTADAVAEKIWTAVADLSSAPIPRFAISGRRPRIALVTPLPPMRSGISDHSAALLKALSRHAEVSAFSQAGGYQPVSGLPYLRAAFDRVVSVNGNSMLHRDIYNYTVKFGAACICHDARLLGLVSGIAGNAKAAMIARRELGRHVTAEDIATWNQDETLRDANFLNDLARAAQPLIFHARKSVLDLRARAGITAAYLPFAIYRPWAGPAITDSARRQARHRLGLGDDEILICSFGFITPNKAVDAALQSFSLLRQSGIKARLSWVGSGLETIAPREPTLRSLELSDHVQFHRSYLSEESYRDYLLAADFGLQLRSGGRGNISGALQDCIAIGLPTVTNNDLAESLNAPSYIARVDDALAPADIAASLRAMITDGRPRTAHEAERADYCARHSMENYAKALCDILAL